MKSKTIYLLFFIFVLSFGIAFDCAAFKGLFGWYEFVKKPWFAPPGIWFFAISSLFYIPLSVAGARLYLSSGKERCIILFLFGLQLFLGLLFSYLFFQYENPILALLSLLFLALTLLFLTVKAAFLDLFSFVLLSPYLLWVFYLIFTLFSVVLFPFLGK